MLDSFLAAPGVTQTGGTRVAESELLPGEVAARVRATVASAQRHGVAHEDVVRVLRAYREARPDSRLAFNRAFR